MKLVNFDFDNVAIIVIIDFDLTSTLLYSILLFLRMIILRKQMTELLHQTVIVASEQELEFSFCATIVLEETNPTRTQHQREHIDEDSWKPYDCNGNVETKCFENVFITFDFRRPGKHPEDETEHQIER